MGIYFESLQQFKQSGGLKQTTITAKQLLPAVVAHMVRMDRKFTLQVNGRLPRSMDALLDEVFALCHLQQPFYTQHCANRHSRYMNISKNRVKIDFTLTYRMSREQEKWVLDEIHRVLRHIITPTMNDLQKILAVHDYIVRAYDYELQTDGSPFTVYTFMHEKQGVCMAYALLFEKMMELLSIPCLYVVGKANGEGDAGHAWNMVQLDNEWYHIDATWNDLGKRSQGHEIRYRYFLRSDAFMETDHQWNLEHYPICMSERFHKLSNVYDVAFINDKLYFPHPRTAFLTAYFTETEKFKALQSTRVQLCTAFQQAVYVCNVDDHGFLYRYEPKSQELVLVEARQVTKIAVQEQQLVVQFTKGENITLQHEAVEQQQVKQQQTASVTLPLMSFSDSWFGTYEGEQTTIAFQSDDGVVVTLAEPVQQLTIDMQLHKGLDIQMTSNRKDVQFEQALQIQLPKAIIGSVTSIKHASGQPLQYEQHGDVYMIEIFKSTKLHF